MTYKEYMQSLSDRCIHFNSIHNIGTEVQYWPRQGAKVVGKTTSNAYINGANLVVIEVEGEAHALDNVTVIRHQEPRILETELK